MVNIGNVCAVVTFIILPIYWLRLIKQCVWRTQPFVEFGSGLPESERDPHLVYGPRPVLDHSLPREELIQTEAFKTLMRQSQCEYAALYPGAPELFCRIQFILMLTIVAALAIDRWTMSQHNWVLFGLIRATIAGEGSETYQNLGLTYIEVAGLFTLIWCLMLMMVVVGLFYQTVLLYRGRTVYHEYHARAAHFQYYQLWLSLLMWSFGGFASIVGFTHGPSGRGPQGYDHAFQIRMWDLLSLTYFEPSYSWYLTLLGLISARSMRWYFRCAIQYRRSPTDPGPIVQQQAENQSLLPIATAPPVHISDGIPIMNQEACAIEAGGDIDHTPILSHQHHEQEKSLQDFDPSSYTMTVLSSSLQASHPQSQSTSTVPIGVPVMTEV